MPLSQRISRSVPDFIHVPDDPGLLGIVLFSCHPYIVDFMHSSCLETCSNRVRREITPDSIRKAVVTRRSYEA